jgi:hypothetical protein
MYKRRVVKNVGRRAGWCIVAVAILALLVGCGIPTSIRQSRAQAHSFVSALLAGNFAHAERMVAPSQRGHISGAYLRTRWKQLEQVIGKPVSAALDEVEVSREISHAGGKTSAGGPSSIVKYTYTITGDNNHESQVMVTLTQQGSRWVVIDVTFSF